MRQASVNPHWQEEDFVLPPSAPAILDDFWDYAGPLAPSSPPDNDDGGFDALPLWAAAARPEASDLGRVALIDPWDADFLAEAPPANEAPDDLPDLPSFERNRAVRVFAFSFVGAPRKPTSAQRARWLVSMLEIPERQRRKRFLGLFEEVFDAYPTSATFRALSGIALDGATPDELYEACRLRMLLEDDYTARAVRRGAGSGFVIQNRSPLSWRAAHRIIVARCGLPAEAAIDPDWFDDWRNAPISGPESWTFIRYAENRAMLFAGGALDIPRVPRPKSTLLDEISLDGYALTAAASRTGALLVPRTFVSETRAQREDEKQDREARHRSSSKEKELAISVTGWAFAE